jgi:hypothetical protein
MAARQKPEKTYGIRHLLDFFAIRPYLVDP